ncbi:MAG: DUF2073 domain-containing protein [Candidatus Aenigmatarchaeota archaeon]
MMKLKFDFVSSAVLESKPRDKRINFILNKVKDGTILVTDGVMSPEEEMELIKETMRRVDEGFPGIEVASLKKPVSGIAKWIEKFSEQKDKVKIFFASLTGEKKVSKSWKTGLTLIGPAKYIKQVKKNPNSFSILTEVK